MKVLLLVSHLSTGGMPQVALKRVEYLLKNPNIDLYMIEYRQIAWSFVVQRNKIIELLGDKFISLGNIWGDGEEKRDKFIEIVEFINPDIIHIEEIPEMFIFGFREEHAEWLYRTERPYKIIETTHTSTYNVSSKKYFPDKFVFVSPYSAEEYKKFNIPYSVVEYPIENFEINKSESLKKLGLKEDYFHILNVGLFTKDKNQGYVFDLAEKLKDYKIHFHFVGNQANNFSEYWKPLNDKRIESCFVHGERDDVDLFYQACDLLIHPSILELNPLAIKEATSYKMPVYLNNLKVYMNMYDSYKNIKYLSMNVDEDAKMILDNFNIKIKNDNYSFDDLLVKEYSDVLESNFKPNSEDYLEYNINFTDGAKVEILGHTKLKFDVEFIDRNNNKLLYKTKIGSNNWAATNIKYYKEYKINIKNGEDLLLSHDFNLNGRKVQIQLDSKSIGDTLAWFPYVEEFRKKHNCKVYCITFWNNWFKDEHPQIIFLEPGNDIPDAYAKYSIGWYQPMDNTRNPNDFRKQPLQKTATDVLGLDFKEIRPKIKIPDGARPIEEKYVCIAQFSTANSKHWHYPFKNSNKGWQIIVDWLNEQGYKVMVISKQPTKLKNIIDRTGNFPIEHRINELKHCEFFIGVGSGLSWLSWAIGKKVVMISGFSNPICEFKSNNINVHNFNVCNGCFNKYTFDRGDWNWCPEHKDTDRHFECSINITPKMVIDRIVSSKLVENSKYFDFNKYDREIIIDPKDVIIIHNKSENKFSIKYNNDIDTVPINIDFKNFTNNKIYYTLPEIVLSKNYITWCVPKEIISNDTDKILVSFYEKNKILDLEIDL